MKINLLLLPVALLCLTGCAINRMNNLISQSTDSIYANKEAVDRSSEVIRQNAQLIEQSNRVIDENRRLLESMNKG
jgi:hypothetical protein